VRYHIDYAEWHRKQTNVICPPLFAITIQVSPLSEGQMEGGDYAANRNGLKHYSKYGFKSCHVPIPDGVPIADWDEPDSGWVKVPYAFNRAVMHPGEWPHLATRVRSLPRGVQRVVIGINPFPAYVGPLEMVAPQHSDAFRKQLKMDKLRALIQGKGGERIDFRSLDAESKRLLARILKKSREVADAQPRRDLNRG
jgi:hypothetical protein